MTSPNGEVPAKANTARSVHSLQGKTQASVAQEINQDMQDALGGVQFNLLNVLLGGFISVPMAVAGAIGSAIANLLGGFGDLISAITGTVNDDYVKDLPIINDHSRTIGEMRVELDTLTIHGMARTLTGDGYYYASPGTVRAEVIMIGAGGAGGTGSWNVIPGSRSGGSGGGGGGENHFTIHGSALFDKVTGLPRPIPYSCGAPSSGGIGNESPGQGGGHTTFDGIIAYGGQGGRYHGGAGVGGYGIVNGGSASPDAPVESKDSLSPFGLYGGGGAGGRGGLGQTGVAQDGGRGGLNPGGTGGGPGVPGADAPSAIELAATGGGGGGGGGHQARGGNGGFPGGGGAGSGGASSAANIQPGGHGAQGVIMLIERSF